MWITVILVAAMTQVSLDLVESAEPEEIDRDVTEGGGKPPLYTRRKEDEDYAIGGTETDGGRPVRSTGDPDRRQGVLFGVGRKQELPYFCGFYRTMPL